MNYVATSRQLSAAFGVPFVAWRKTEGAWSAEPPQDDEDRLPYGFFEWLDRTAEAGDAIPSVVELADGHCYIGTTSLDDDDARLVVLAGRQATAVDRLEATRRTARLAVRAATIDFERRDQQELLDAYADKLTGCFEEMSFLRRLSRQIEFCNPQQSLSNVAKSMLAQLRSLVGVAGLSLVLAEQNDDGEIGIGGVSATSGDKHLDDEERRRVIEALRQRGAEVAVWNRSPQHHFPPGIENDRIRSLALAPVVKDGATFGWLLAVNKVDRGRSGLVPVNSLGHDEIGSIEASLMESAATMLASQAANAMLFAQKEALVVDVIHTLVSVIEARDEYTCGHSDRVALVAKRLAEQMKLSAEFVHQVYLSGLLHDIGKVGVPDDVLLKPGKLTDAEFDEIKKHPVTGARMLKGLAPLEPLIPGVLHHHESLDGKGYPSGLVGTEIPLMARILAVADSYDAMTSDRPYRPGMPIDKAEGILRNGSGRQWDADVIDAYFEARDDVARISNEWRDHLAQILGKRAATRRVGANVANPASIAPSSESTAAATSHHSLSITTGA